MKPAISGSNVSESEDGDYCWEWQNDEDSWEVYGEEDSALLEKLFRDGKKVVVTDKFSFSEGYGTEYKIDFKAMTQKNLDSETVRWFFKKYQSNV